MRKIRLSRFEVLQTFALGFLLVLTGSVAQAEWTAYNDGVFDAANSATDPNGQAVHYKHANATDIGIGTVSADSATYTQGTQYPTTAGTLLKISDGTSTGATLTITQTGNGVNWQPQVSCLPTSASCGWHGGYDTAIGTDAYDTFNGIVDMTGVTYYANAVGWTVNYAFTGLDPAEKYTFACSAARSKLNTEGAPGYPIRIAWVSISDADASTNSSTAGTTDVNADGLTIGYNTGDNHSLGYVVRWTDIEPGADGDFSVSVTHDPAAQDLFKAYACSVLLLEEQAATVIPPFTPTVPSLSGWGYGALLLAVFGVGAFALRRRNA